MLEYIKQEADMTTTENGAVTYASTGSRCLDLFATIGALRRQNEKEIIARFIRAYKRYSGRIWRKKGISDCPSMAGKKRT